MMILDLAARIVALVLCIIGASVIILHVMKWFLVRRRLKKHYREHPQPTFAVGSPEYNALVIGAIHAVNEQLAPEGKRIPEKIAIGFINETLGFPDNHRMNDPECQCEACTYPLN